jgi:hypothetical protein
MPVDPGVLRSEVLATRPYTKATDNVSVATTAST